MTDKENLNPVPEKDKQDKPESVSLEGNEPSAEPSVAIPEKFKGKSVEEIVKSYNELEKAYSEKGVKQEQELKQEDESSIDDLIKLFLPEAPAKEPEKAQPSVDEEANKRAYVAQQIRQKLELDILKARTNPSMVGWGDVEKDVIAMAMSKPYVLNSPTWTADCYDVISAKKEKSVLEAKLKEIEERGKVVAMVEEKKAEAQIVGGAEMKAPAPTKPVVETPQDRLAKINDLVGKARKDAMTKLIEDTLTDAEKAA
jgi:hypothetical protein